MSVNVVQGALVYVGADDCVQREYPGETAFVDIGHGDVHAAFNRPTDDATVLVELFISEALAGGWLTQTTIPGTPVGRVLALEHSLLQSARSSVPALALTTQGPPLHTGYA